MTEIVFFTLKQERIYLEDQAIRSEARSILFSTTSNASTIDFAGIQSRAKSPERYELTL